MVPISAREDIIPPFTSDRLPDIKIIKFSGIMALHIYLLCNLAAGGDSFALKGFEKSFARILILK